MEQFDLKRNLDLLEKELDLIKRRNQKVELEKAWEVSLVRKVAILVLTYLIASLVMYLIEVERFWLNAIIPTLGYFLSTLSVSFLKEQWINTQSKRNGTQ